jgi:hypothetical protein
MRKVIMLEENELEDIVKNTDVSRSVLHRIVDNMENANDIDMGTLYKELKAVTNALDKVREIL